MAVDPNSPDELARVNALYGPGGTAMTKPTDASVWNPTSETWGDGKDWTKDPQWAGLDPRLVALYQKHGITPQGRGTGFTDAAYWNEQMKNDPSYDFLGRLDKDLSGTGTDRSTGTVWGATGAPKGLDQNASDTANYAPGGAGLASLAGGGSGAPGVAPVFDVTSQGTGPGSYAWRQQQIYALQQRLINGGAR